MEDTKKQNIIHFYLLANKLKELVRSGWVQWHIDEKERIESVAEHIYGCLILAIAIDSEYVMQIDLSKVLLMLILHEIEEINIGDLTPFDKVTKEAKREQGKIAVQQILSHLTKQYQYLDLIQEFEECKTAESQFAKQVDKLEADIQAKIYCEKDRLDLHDLRNQAYLKDERVIRLLKEGCTTIADLFIENDKPLMQDNLLSLADYIKNNQITDDEM